MGTALRSDLDALETREKPLAGFTRSDERDEAVRWLIREIESDRARLLASTTSEGGLTKRATFWPDCPI